MSRIGVLLKSQGTADLAHHYVSRSLAEVICNGRAAVRISKKLIHLLTDETFSSTKDRFRSVAHATVVDAIPVRDWNEGLVLSYPAADQSSYAKQNRLKTWGLKR